MLLSNYTFSMFWEAVIKKLKVWVLILDLEWTYWAIGKRFLDVSWIHSFLYSAASVIQATTPFLLDCCCGLVTVPFPSPTLVVPGSLLCCGDLWQAYSSQGSPPAPLLGCPSSSYFLTCSLMKCYLCREPAPTTLSKTGFLVLLYTSQWHLPTVSCFIC